jgi:hypothetical protein
VRAVPLPGVPVAHRHPSARARREGREALMCLTSTLRQSRRRLCRICRWP